MRVRFVPLVGRLNDFKLYVRLDPTINGNGGGGTDNAGSDDGSIAAVRWRRRPGGVRPAHDQ